MWGQSLSCPTRLYEWPLFPYLWSFLSPFLPLPKSIPDITFSERDTVMSYSRRSLHIAVRQGPQ